MVLCTWTRGSRVRCAPRQRRPGRAARAAGRRTRSLPDSLRFSDFGKLPNLKKKPKKISIVIQKKNSTNSLKSVQSPVPPRRLRGSDVDSTPQCIPYILSALPYVPGSPTIHQHDPRRHYLICGRQSIRRQTRCACDVEMLMQKGCRVMLRC